MRFVQPRITLAILSTAFVLATAGCATFSQHETANRTSAPALTLSRNAAATPISNGTASAQDTIVPKVQDCGIVTISSPSKYVCNGKIYTAFQLQHLREKGARANAGS
jgi:hypothetical protein